MSKLNKVFDLFVLLLQFFYSFNSFFSVFFSVLNHITILNSFIYKLQPFLNTVSSIIYFLHELSRIEQPCQLRAERLLYNLLINKVLLLLVLPDYLKQVVLSATPKSVASKMTELTLDQYLSSFLPIVIWSGKTIDWNNWDTYIVDLVCRCANESRARNYSHFSIQYYGNCQVNIVFFIIFN